MEVCTLTREKEFGYSGEIFYLQRSSKRKSTQRYIRNYPSKIFGSVL